MTETAAMTATTTEAMPTEYLEAVELHRSILANAEVAAGAMLSLCRNLKRMRDDRLYRQLGYESFEEYAEQAVGIKKRQAYNYITVLERLPTELLQSNAHLGITKLELLTQVPALEREEFLLENDPEQLSTRELKELVEQVRQQGEQLSLLQEEKEELERDNTDLVDKNRALLEKNEALSTVSWEESEAARKLEEQEKALSEARQQLEQLREEKATLEQQAREPAQPAEPDEATLARIREEARAEAEESIQQAEQAAAEKIEERLEKERAQAAAEAEQRMKEAFATVEEEKAQALARSEELARQLQVSGSSDTLLFRHLFDQFQEDFTRITGHIETVRQDSPETAKKFQGALHRALEQLTASIAGGM